MTRLTSKVNLEFGIDGTDLNWSTKNTESVIINPKVGARKSAGSEHVAISESTEFTLVAKGLFSETEKTTIAHPFPVPVIESILTETPKIELNYNFSTENLKVPKSILEHQKFISIII